MTAYAPVQVQRADPALARETPVLRLVTSDPVMRSGYQPPHRSKPVAFCASLGIVAALGSAFVMLSGPTIILKKQKPLVVTMELLPPPPPEVSQETPPPPPATPQLVAPPPIVRVPTPPAMVPAPSPETPLPPTIVSVPAPSVAAAPAPPAPPAPPAEPVSGDLSLNMLDATPPRYPVESRRKREQGIVRLSVLVGTDGRVADVGVAGSSGSERLDQAALSAVRRWRWSPLKRGGVATMVRGIVTIPFVLKG